VPWLVRNLLRHLRKHREQTAVEQGHIVVAMGDPGARKGFWPCHPRTHRCQHPNRMRMFRQLRLYLQEVDRRIEIVQPQVKFEALLALSCSYVCFSKALDVSLEAWAGLPLPTSLRQFQLQFASEKASQHYLAPCRWPDGYVFTMRAGGAEFMA
jgi:hypothetical protein